ncbi:FecCD family ABC transporter permease [Parapedobacter koreensis]|nr:iron ABC transporter permease [Parapedobacter koreensis]
MAGTTKTYTSYVTMLLLLVLAVILSLSWGAMPIPIGDVVVSLLQRVGLYEDVAVDELYSGVIALVRLPRAVMGLLVGASLGISGAAIQAIFRNPLAEPGIIGVSAGASFVAALLIAFEATLFTAFSDLFGHYLLALGAFSGAGAATWLVYRISLVDGRPHISTMLLAGIAINAMAGALTGLISYLADEQQLRTITFWMLGSLGGASWETVIVLLPFTVLTIIGLPLLSKPLNAFALGEQEAHLLGFKPTQVKRLVILLATLAVGASVAMTGIIGFIGLLVPHGIRMLGGADNRYVLPASALLGALTLTVADLLARIVALPAELPIGVITALLGTPLFLYILIRDKKKIIH